MKAYQDDEYRGEFPEIYNWDKLDSNKLSEIAKSIQGWLQYDLKSTDRKRASGLRKALNVIAEKAELF